MHPIATVPESTSLDASVDERHGGAWSRLANVVLDPQRAFAAIAARPTWAVAFVALVALRFASLVAFYRPATTPAKVIAGVLFQLGVVLPPALAMTFALWLVAMGWRVTLPWSRAWSIVLHVMFAHALATVMIASVAGALLPASAAVDLRHPPFTDVGSLVSEDAPRALRALAAALDVRMLYAFVLTWLAVRCGGASRSRVAGAVWTAVAVYLATALVTPGR